MKTFKQFLEENNLEDNKIVSSYEEAKALVKKWGYNIQFISKDTENYYKLCEIAVKKNGYSIQYISKDTENYYKLCEIAVKEYSRNIQYISKDTENYYKLCEISVNDCGSSIQYIPKDTKNYYKLCEIAINGWGYNIRYIPKDTENYHKLCEIAVSNWGYNIQYIPKDTENYYKLCGIAVKQDKDSLEYIDRTAFKKELFKMFEDKTEKTEYEETPNYYKFELDGKEYDFFDLEGSMEKKYNKEKVEISMLQYAIQMKTLEYLFRCFFKEQTKRDLEQAIKCTKILLKIIK